MPRRATTPSMTKTAKTPRRMASCCARLRTSTALPPSATTRGLRPIIRTASIAIAIGTENRPRELRQQAAGYEHSGAEDSEGRDAVQRNPNGARSRGEEQCRGHVRRDEGPWAKNVGLNTNRTRLTHAPAGDTSRRAHAKTMAPSATPRAPSSRACDSASCWRRCR